MLAGITIRNRTHLFCEVCILMPVLNYRGERVSGGANTLILNLQVSLSTFLLQLLFSFSAEMESLEPNPNKSNLTGCNFEARSSFKFGSLRKDWTRWLPEVLSSLSSSGLLWLLLRRGKKTGVFLVRLVQHFSFMHFSINKGRKYH